MLDKNLGGALTVLINKKVKWGYMRPTTQADKKFIKQFIVQHKLPFESYPITEELLQAMKDRGVLVKIMKIEG